MSDQDPPAHPDEGPPNGPDTDPDGEPTRVDTPVSEPTMAMPAAAGGPPTAPYTPDEPPPTEPPGTGEPPPPDRRPWVIIGLLIVLLLVGLAIWFGMDDDEVTGDTTSTSTSSTTTSSTTTTTAPTTTTTAPTTTTAAPSVTIDPARCVSSEPDDPDITANVVVDAYQVGDRDCASNLMTDEALDDLFAIPGGGGGWEFRGCDEVNDPETDPTSCAYRFEGGSTTLNMQYDNGWVVFEVFQTAD